MSRLFYHTMQDNAGNLLFDVSGTMRLAGTGTLATIYGDEALTIPIANPMTNHPSFGSFKCFLGAGDYDFYMAKSGYTFETLTGVQGHGTMAQQDASDVNISGGYIVATQIGANATPIPGYALTIGGPVWQPAGSMGLDRAPVPGVILTIGHDKALGEHGMILQPTGADTGGQEILFANVAGTPVGGITTNATTTTYGTTSDGRLKHAVEDLAGELALIRALRPVSFLWNSDESPGVGFIASEVAAHVQGVITGEEGAVNPDGTIKPQMIDYSKLVPFLVGACQTLARRLAVLEDALGI